ncbi:MAG: hypothetical protein H6705_17960 [Myxococcales bacterium]|nr:hypothetical protein [Myxococcales bacterium]
MKLPELDRASRRRWSETLDRLMQAAGLSKALAVASAGDFEIKGFEDAFSRLKNGDHAELERWFVQRDGEKAKSLAEALGIDYAALCDALQASTHAPAAPWHAAFPSVEPDDAFVDVPLPDDLPPSGEGEPDEARLERWVEDIKTPIWIIGPPGSGRRTQARRLERLGCGPITDTPPPAGWSAWAARASARAIAIVDVPPPGRYGDKHLRTQPWDAALLSALVERLAGTGALSAEQADRGRALAASWRDDPDLIAPPFARPADLIGLLGALSDPGLAIEPGSLRRHLFEVTWRAICQRAPLLAGWDAELLTDFWRRCWRAATLPIWWSFSPSEAEALVAATLRDLRGPDELADLLDALEVKATRARLTNLRRALDGVGPGAVLSALIVAGVLRETDTHRLVAADPRQATLWAAAGLAGQRPFLLDLPWTRLGDAHCPELCEALVESGVAPDTLARALAPAPPRWRLDADRGLLHALAATDAMAPFDPTWRGWLVRAWADVIWAHAEGLFSDTRAVIEHEGTPAYATGRRLRELSVRWADELPLLAGPGWAAALVEGHISPRVEGLVRRWRYAGRPSMMSLASLHGIRMESPFRESLTPRESSVGGSRTRLESLIGEMPARTWELSAERYLDFVIAWLAPAQCLPLDPTHLPAGFSGRDWLSHLPATVWARCEVLAQRGDRAAIELLSGRWYAPHTDPGGFDLGWGALWTTIPIEQRRRWVAAGKDTEGFVERWLALIDDRPETLLTMARDLDDAEVHALMHRALQPGAGALGTDIWSRWNDPRPWKPSGPPGPRLAPSLTGIVSLARARRDTTILDEVCALPDRWLTLARPEYIAGRCMVGFDVQRCDDPWADREPKPPLVDAFALRDEGDGALWRGFELLAGPAHEAAAILLALGRRAAMDDAWAKTADDWPPTLCDALSTAELWAELQGTEEGTLAAHFDAMPSDVEAIIERLWDGSAARRDVRGPDPTPTAPTLGGYDTVRRFGLRPMVVLWLKQERDGWLLPHDIVLRIHSRDAELTDDDMRWLRGALVMKLLSVCGSRVGWDCLSHMDDGRSDGTRPWQAWLRALAADGAARRYHFDRQARWKQRLRDLLDTRRARAGQALIDAGDDAPVRALLEVRLPPSIARSLLDPLLEAPAALGALWQKVEDPVEWGDGRLFAAALKLDLPPAIAALAAQPRLRRRVAVHAHWRRPWAARLIEALSDEAWGADEHREAAAWAVMLHLEHHPWNPLLERSVRHWLCDDPAPFDRTHFADRDHRFVGGAHVLADLADAWLDDGKRPRWWTDGVRGLVERVGLSPMRPVSYDFEPMARDAIHLFDTFGRGWSHTSPGDLIWRWLREIGAVDIRDAYLDAMEDAASYPHSAALDWWTRTADDAALRAALAHVDRSPGFHSRHRAFAAVEELISRSDAGLADQLVELCAHPLPSEGDPLPGWFGTRGHMTPDGRCMYLLRVAPERIIDVHQRWLAEAETVDQRVYILRHLALMSEMLAEHGIDARAEVRRLTEQAAPD